MSSHTPGPWYVIPHPEHPQGKSRIDSNSQASWENYGQIAYVAPNNARLIAAAPEMLEALEDVYEDIFINENNRRHTKIRKIIEKVKGVQT